MAMRSDEYLAPSGRACPHCRSFDVDGDKQSIIIDANGVTKEMWCNDCNATWLDAHYRAGYSNLKVPDET